MQVSIHSVKNIKVTQDHHTSYGPGFYCMNIDIETTDGKHQEVRLFSDEAMVLINPEIKEVGE